MSKIQETVKLMFVGDGSVGKTCYLIALTDEKFPTEYVPTVFENYSSTFLYGNEAVCVGLWDTAGREDYDRLRPFSYPGTSCFIVCVSIVGKESIDRVTTKWLPEIFQHNGEKASIVLCVMKNDLRECEETLATLERKGESIEENVAAINEIADKYGYPVVFSSALNLEVKPAFDEILKAAVTYEEEQRGQSSNSSSSSSSSSGGFFSKLKKMFFIP